MNKEESKTIFGQRNVVRETRGSRIPGFYRLPVERRLAYLAKRFNLTEHQLSQLRNGSALRIEHAVNMVENAVGVLGMPLGLGLNFLVDGEEYLVPMAIEEASIIAAASKAALMIREGGGFKTIVDDPVMIGQVQVVDLPNIEAAAERIQQHREEIIQQANLANPRMVTRGGGVIDVEARILSEGSDCDPMLIVHLLMDVREAMGANAINYACEAVGPLIESITGGQVILRILSNYATKRIVRSSFEVPFHVLETENYSGNDVARRMVAAGQFARMDTYRATTHNKGIFNGIGAAALALGQDWRAIEAGGHAYASRDGKYRSLTKFRIEPEKICGSIELPLQVGWVGGAVNSHPGVRFLRRISGVANSRELSGLLASVGLGQNFAACYALATDGIQKGHMALHARSVALSVGVPAEQVETVAQKMIEKGEVKVAVAEAIYRKMQDSPMDKIDTNKTLVKSVTPGKVVLFGEHATVYNYPGITAAININLTLKIKPDPDGPRFLNPHFKRPFDVPGSDQDLRLFSQAVNMALARYRLQNEPVAIEIESDLVPGMGLGSSAAFSAALCTAIRQYAKQDSSGHWDGSLFDEVQELEAIFHGHPSGMDAATVLSEGVIWFRKGPPREIIPIRLPEEMSGIVCLVEPGARTIQLVRQVRRSRDLNPKRVNGILDEIGNLTVDAGIALGTGDREAVGKLMFRNHELLARLGVSTRSLDKAVEYLLSRGVYGAKLTGSGGGGAVIALVPKDKQYDYLEEFEERFAMAFPFTLGVTA